MAARELSKFEQETLIAALDKIDEATKARKIAEHAAAIEQEKAGRIAAEAKIGELSAEMVRRSDGYQTALASEARLRAQIETKLLQEREARSTADLLAAQYRAEAEATREQIAETQEMFRALTERVDALSVSQPQVITAPAAQPSSYRINVVGRDAAGDLRTLELVPIERT